MAILQPALAREQTTVPTSIGEHGQALRGYCVLVVDDDTSVRRLVARVFSRAGAIICEAQGAAVALTILQDIQPQLLVSDVNMPGENGYSLMRHVRALDARCGGAIASIALTGDGNPTGRRDALQAGFDEYLSKPFSPSELVRISIALLAGEKAPTRR